MRRCCSSLSAPPPMPRVGTACLVTCPKACPCVQTATPWNAATVSTAHDQIRRMVHTKPQRVPGAMVTGRPHTLDRADRQGQWASCVRHHYNWPARAQREGTHASQGCQGCEAQVKGTRLEAPAHSQHSTPLSWRTCQRQSLFPQDTLRHPLCG